MKIAFLDLLNWDYTVESVDQIPLGGSHSAICYLSQELAKQQLEVFLLNNTIKPTVSYEVVCLPLPQVSPELFQDLDVLVINNQAGEGQKIKNLLSPGSTLILWNHHSYDQPPIQQLKDPADQDSYDGIAFVSNWQRDRFHEHFNTDPKKAGVMRNAVSNYFLKMFAHEESIVAHKSKPPILAYTSTPFRGLDLLLEVFPRIREAIPGVRLKVFSSMKVYQVEKSQDQLRYGGLYRACQETEGVEYIGSVPQQELAQELKTISVLAYPNTFEETSCISVMEAMASGCWVVTSDFGALSETAAGFGNLIAVDNNWERYKDEFVQATITALRKFQEKDVTDLEAYLRKQVDFVNNSYTWSNRATEWLEWIKALAFNAQKIAQESFLDGDYEKAIKLYHQGLRFYPEDVASYWYLGLSLLLTGDKAEAEQVWMSAIFNNPDAKSDDLIAVLETELARLKQTNCSHLDLIEICLEELTHS